jgi:hypothetical protein
MRYWGRRGLARNRLCQPDHAAELQLALMTLRIALTALDPATATPGLKSFPPAPRQAVR